MNACLERVPMLTFALSEVGSATVVDLTVILAGQRVHATDVISHHSS